MLLLLNSFKENRTTKLTILQLSLQNYICIIFKNFIYFFSECVRVCAHKHMHVCVEVRGELVGFSSLLLPFANWGRTLVSVSLGSKHFCLLSHFISPELQCSG